MTELGPNDMGKNCSFEIATDKGVKALIEGVQDGPWESGPCRDRSGHISSWDIYLPREPDATGVAVVASCYSGEATARFIAAARTDLPRLLGEIERLREALRPLAAKQLPRDRQGNVSAYSFLHSEIEAAQAALSGAIDHEG